MHMTSQQTIKISPDLALFIASTSVQYSPIYGYTLSNFLLNIEMYMYFDILKGTYSILFLPMNATKRLFN